MRQRGESKRGPLPGVLPPEEKRRAGSTPAAQTPLAIRVRGTSLDRETREHVRRRLGRQLGKFALHVESASVRFSDVNGPRGGADQECRIKVVVSTRPSIVVASNAASAREAFDRASARVTRAVRRALERAAGGELPRRRPARASSGERPATQWPAGPANPPPEDGSLIGRRVGRSRERLERVAERPEKRRRDVPVDTAQPGRSASDRKAGGGSTAPRNTKLDLEGMSATLEDSTRDRPSRKSTRRSVGGSRQDTGLRQRAVESTHAPSARARADSPHDKRR